MEKRFLYDVTYSLLERKSENMKCWKNWSVQQSAAVNSWTTSERTSYYDRSIRLHWLTANVQFISFKVLYLYAGIVYTPFDDKNARCNTMHILFLWKNEAFITFYQLHCVGYRFQWKSSWWAQTVIVTFLPTNPTESCLRRKKFCEWRFHNFKGKVKLNTSRTHAKMSNGNSDSKKNEFDLWSSTVFVAGWQEEEGWYDDDGFGKAVVLLENSADFLSRLEALHFPGNNVSHHKLSKSSKCVRYGYHTKYSCRNITLKKTGSGKSTTFWDIFYPYRIQLTCTYSHTYSLLHYLL